MSVAAIRVTLGTRLAPSKDSQKEAAYRWDESPRSSHGIRSSHQVGVLRRRGCGTALTQPSSRLPPSGSSGTRFGHHRPKSQDHRFSTGGIHPSPRELSTSTSAVALGETSSNMFPPNPPCLTWFVRFVSQPFMRARPRLSLVGVAGSNRPYSRQTLLFVFARFPRAHPKLSVDNASRATCL